LSRAAALAWEHGLRGYDAVHLASALAWSEALGETVAVATYDRELWRGAKASGLSVGPAAMP
jgi:predicted nucleic acid-binding protein